MLKYVLFHVCLERVQLCDCCLMLKSLVNPSWKLLYNSQEQYVRQIRHMMYLQTASEQMGHPLKYLHNLQTYFAIFR